jgi:hypothetical protein
LSSLLHEPYTGFEISNDEWCQQLQGRNMVKHVSSLGYVTASGMQHFLAISMIFQSCALYDETTVIGSSATR